MIEGLDEYFRRWMLFNSAAGLLFIIVGLMFQLNTLVYLIGICVFIAGNRVAFSPKEQRTVIQTRGRQILKENPPFIWIAIAVTIVPSMAMGLGAYYSLGKSFESSLFIFLGFYCLLTIQANKKMLPYYESGPSEILG